MSAVWCLVFWAQASTWAVSPSEPTVGDTVVVERRVVLPDAGARLEPQAFQASAQLEPLRQPVVLARGEGWVVRYAIAFFTPGPQRLAMPAIGVTYRDGRMESLSGGALDVVVRSVLPDGDPLPDPRSSLGPMTRSSRRVEPVLILAGAVLIVVGVWGVYRRRARPRPVWSAGGGTVAVPVARWVAAGESRAAAALTMDGMRTRIAELVPEANRSLSAEECLQQLEALRPEWPLQELGEVVQALERASFAPAVGGDPLALAERADRIIRSLNGPGVDATRSP